MEHILFGAAYYDEYMPYDRIETDMQMMKKAGMNVIRIAESTWSTLEPQDGIFDFAHLDRMLDAAEKYDIHVIVGTPSYAIPTWLAKKSDTILAITNSGKEIYGHRQNMDITDPTYLKYTERVIRALMEHIKGRDCIIGYQLDNETKHYNTAGAHAQELFVSYLKEQFPSLDKFNLEFGLDYWSNRVNDWADFPDIRGTINGSLAAEYEKFKRLLVTNFLHWQSDIVREYKKPKQFITQNFDFEWHDYSYGLQPDVNQFAAVQCMDIAGCDIYHPSQDDLTGAEISFCGSIARGLRKDNYLILETEAQGNLEWLPYPGQLCMQAYSHLACGADSVMYWHWHSIHNSLESYWKGVLSHDFSENPTYLEACKLGHELQEYGSHLLHLKKKNQAAIMVSNDSLTGMRMFPLKSHGDSSYNDVVRWLSDSLYRLNIEFDVIDSTETDLAQYRLIAVPALYSASEDVLIRLNDYVAAGGHLIATFKSGFSNEHLKIYSDMQPHILKDCCGIHYSQFTAPKNVRLEGKGILSACTGTATDWMELLIPDTATTLFSYVHPYWGKYSAVTYHHYGKGSACYIGCLFENATIDSLIAHLAKDMELMRPDFQFPLILHKGINQFGKQIRYYFNYSGESHSFVYDAADGTSLLEQQAVAQGSEITLQAWDYKIIESDY